MSERPAVRAPAQNDTLRRAGLRNRGHDDGRMGRPPRSSDSEYLTSYRRGAEKRNGAVTTTETPQGAA